MAAVYLCHLQVASRLPPLERVGMATMTPNAREADVQYYRIASLEAEKFMSDTAGGYSAEERQLSEVDE